MKTRAIVLHQNGDADQMVWEDVDLLSPTDSQVLVKHEFVGFNMVDTYHRSGIYPTPPKPCRLGTEGAGIVEVVGSKVTDFSVGDLVKFVERYKGSVRRAYDVVVANPAQYTTLKNDMLHHARSKSDQTHVSPKFAKTADRNIVPFSSRSQSMQK